MLKFLVYLTSVLGLVLTQDTDLTSPKVIIIGTGPSGIAAGTKLYENGVKNILWLEAENRIGGRINTRKFGANVLDFGAQWCHGEKDNTVYKLANPLGLLASSRMNLSDINTFPSYFEPSGTSLPHQDAHKVYTSLEDILGTDEITDFNGSVGDYLDLKFQERLKNELREIDHNVAKNILQWYQKLQNLLEASDSMYDVSSKRFDDFWDSEGDNGLNWKGRGYKTILDLLMKKIPDASKALALDDKFLLNKEVVNIDWSGPGVTVKCTDGTQYTADHVIVTVSLGVLKERSATLFTPELPSNKLKSINGLNFGTVNKLFLEFSQPWWPANFTGFSFVWNDKDIAEKLSKFDGSLDENKWLLDVMGIYPIDYQPNILLGWIVSSSARTMEELPEAEVKAKVMQLIRMFLDKHYNIPEPAAFLRTQWSTNPHFRGSYSYRSLTTEHTNASAADLAEPLRNAAGKENVMFAGEATESHHFSTVHGAIESGFREAYRLLVNLYKVL